MSEGEAWGTRSALSVADRSLLRYESRLGINFQVIDAEALRISSRDDQGKARIFRDGPQLSKEFRSGSSLGAWGDTEGLQSTPTRDAERPSPRLAPHPFDDPAAMATATPAWDIAQPDMIKVFERSGPPTAPE